MISYLSFCVLQFYDALQVKKGLRKSTFLEATHKFVTFRIFKSLRALVFIMLLLSTSIASALCS